MGNVARAEASIVFYVFFGNFLFVKIKERTNLWILISCPPDYIATTSCFGDGTWQRSRGPICVDRMQWHP
jgi:hypothetical protein